MIIHNIMKTIYSIGAYAVVVCVVYAIVYTVCLYNKYIEFNTDTKVKTSAAAIKFLIKEDVKNITYSKNYVKIRKNSLANWINVGFRDFDEYIQYQDFYKELQKQRKASEQAQGEKELAELLTANQKKFDKNKDMEQRDK